MIRNLVVGRLKPDADPELVSRGLAEIVTLEIDGMAEIRAGRDAGLREGNWDYAITADFTDEAAYRRYDLDDEHNRMRREYFGVFSADIVRIQFTL